MRHSDRTSLVQVPRLLLRWLSANQKTQHPELDGRGLKVPRGPCGGTPSCLHLSKTLTFACPKRQPHRHTALVLAGETRCSGQRKIQQVRYLPFHFIPGAESLSLTACLPPDQEKGSQAPSMASQRYPCDSSSYARGSS